VSPPLGGCKAELARIAPDRVGQLRAIADQPVTDADQHQGRLLLSRLHRHEAHGRPAHRLANASASAASFLPRLRYGLTSCGAINFTECPYDCSSRAVKLENVFRRIHTNSANLVHGRPLCLRSTATSFWHA
jgi:hypothetical protein